MENTSVVVSLHKEPLKIKENHSEGKQLSEPEKVHATCEYIIVA